MLRKPERPVQSQNGMLKTFMTNLILLIFCRLKARLTDILRRKCTSKKKNQLKAWYKILGPEKLQRYEEFHKSQKKTKYIRQNENSLDSLASNLSYS